MLNVCNAPFQNESQRSMLSHRKLIATKGLFSSHQKTIFKCFVVFELYNQVLFEYILQTIKSLDSQTKATGGMFATRCFLLLATLHCPYRDTPCIEVVQR